MATYGDITLDEIMRSVRASDEAAGGAAQTNRPQFRITQASSVLPNLDAAPVQQPFYKRPIQIPEGLKSAGRGAMKLLGRGAGPLAVAGSVLPAAELLKAASEAAANAYVGPPSVQATVARGRAGYGAAPKPAPTLEAGPAAAPAQTEDQRAAALEVGRLQAAREALVQAAQVGTTPGNFAGQFTGAVLGLKAETGRAVQQTARDKLMQDLFTKLPGMRKSDAETTNLQSRQALAAQARARGASEADVSAILSGRATGGQFAGFPTAMADKIDVLNRGTGAVQRVTPKAPVTEAHIAADMKNKKLDRAQVLAEYQRQGYDIRGF